MKAKNIRLSAIPVLVALGVIFGTLSIKVIGGSGSSVHIASAGILAEASESSGTNKVLDLDGSNFSKTIEKGIVLVDFWATWCGPCRVQIPILDELAREIGNKAVITKLDVDKNRSIAQQFNIRSIPTLLLFKDGKVVRTFMGVTQKNVLMAAINELK